ncbi:MAG: response regulator [bacterium]|nr:response regulator [bacterium]
MNKLKILVVDDKADNRYLLEKLLQGNGYETVSASNGAEALDLALKIPPDLVISDILMPVMDGFMLCREWKKNERLNKIPFIFYTATYTDPKDEEFAMSLGAARFIVKPEEPTRFLEIIQETIEEFRTGTIEPSEPIKIDDSEFTKGHREALFRKLEDKIIQARTAEVRAKQYAGELEKNIAELKRTEKLLQQANLVVENSPVVLFRWRAVEGWPVVYVSQNVIQFGYTPEELLSGAIPYASIIYPEDLERVAAEVQQYSATGVSSFQQEYRIITKDGDIRWIDDRTTIERDSTGKITHYQGIIIDITERKKSEQKVIDAYANLQRILEETVGALSSALESRDPYTAGHERRDAQLACAIAQELKLSEQQIEGIRIASLLHDIGKMAVPAEILAKPTKLTELEFSLIKIHPEVGYNILKDIEFPWPIAQIVYQHHERLDGSGYPRGLKGDEIMFEARILAVADVVEAMASHRPYRPALGIEKALEEIISHCGKLYDPKVAEICRYIFLDKGFKFE